jgi:hypothetical protein
LEIKLASVVTGQLAVVVAALCDLDHDQKVELNHQFHLVRDDVMGNRSGETIVSNADARRMMLLRLRICVSELERVEREQHEKD